MPVYRGRLVSKNQMTIPVQMQQELGMAKGDELEFVVENSRVIQVHVLRPVRVDLLPDDVLESLKRRAAATTPAERKLSSQTVRALAEGGAELSAEESNQELPTRAAAG